MYCIARANLEVNLELEATQPPEKVHGRVAWILNWNSPLHQKNMYVIDLFKRNDWNRNWNWKMELDPPPPPRKRVS